MRAYFDESAVSPQDGQYMIMAGFVGSMEAFKNASDSWQKCLDELPSIPFFHHKDPNCFSKIDPLSKVLGAHDLRGFAITIPHAPFANRNAKLAKGQIGSRVYDWAFIHTVLSVLGWVHTNFPEDERVDFIFEQRREFKLCSEKFYEPFKAEGDGIWRRAGTCTSEADKKLAPLQMGDLLAGQSLVSIRTGRKSEAINNIEKNRKLLHFNRAPPDVIERNLTLQNLGGTLFHSGLKKIISAGEWVDPALYQREYQGLMAINSLIIRDGQEMRREMERLDRVAAARQNAVPFRKD